MESNDSKAHSGDHHQEVAHDVSKSSEHLKEVDTSKGKVHASQAQGSADNRSEEHRASHKHQSHHQQGELQRLDSPRFKHESPDESHIKQNPRDSQYEKVDNIDRLLDQSQQTQNKTQTNQLFQSNQDYAIKEFYNKRKERQQAQKDAEILANRIALLKQEEIRTLKKIEETRKKALEVYYLKKKNDEKQRKVTPLTGKDGGELALQLRLPSATTPRLSE